MNKKLIAAAVSAAVVAPVAAYGEATFYGRINNAIDLNDVAAEGDSSTDLSTVSSRFGFKYNQEVGNGMTVHGRYEFSTTTDKEKSNADGAGGVEDIRIATAGLSGSFGRIDVGNQWSSYFNTFGTLVSPTYTLGYYLYSGVAGGVFRASNTIKYSNNFGPLYAELDIRLNEDGGETADTAETLRGEGVGLGLRWAVTDNITIAAAYDSEDREDANDSPARPAITFTGDTTASDGIGGTSVTTADEFGHDEDRLGIAVNANFGGYWITAGWQNYELDNVEPIAFSGTFDFNDDGDAADTDVNGLNETSVTGTIEPNDDIDSFFLYGGGNFGEKTSWMLGYSEADDGVEIALQSGVSITTETDDSSQVVWAVYHNLGGGLRLYYEATDFDSENTGNDGARHLLGMRVDF